MSAILTEIMQLLTGGITDLAQGIGSGVSVLVKDMFLETTGTGAEAVTHLSTFGGIVIIFAGVSLAIGLSKLIFNMLTSLGNN